MGIFNAMMDFASNGDSNIDGLSNSIASMDGKAPNFTLKDLYDRMEDSK